MCERSLLQILECTPRLLIVCAHPDDEVIGMGGQLHLLREPFVVHTTDGAPLHTEGRVDYTARRRRELECALKLVNISSGRLFTLGAVDQESVKMIPELCRRLVRLIAELRPQVIVTHPYEGGHPDHDTTALIVSRAAAHVAVGQGTRLPVLEFTSYHNGDPHGECYMRTGEFLANPEMEIETKVLSKEEVASKTAMLSCFDSQRAMLRNFAVGVERFRRAPAYDFRQPPHTGRLFYEVQGWGVSGEEWRRLAELFLRDEPR